MVHLINKGSKLTLKWDGEEFELKNNEKKELDEGVANHFVEKFAKDKDVKLEIQEIKEEQPKKRSTKKEQKDEKAFKELEG